jgi:uncharacterized protein (TIGR00255 family)
MESMTGYAYLEAKNSQFSFSIEIKSLNSKYNEYYINLPRPLRGEENSLQGLVSDRVKRGKVELNLEVLEWFDLRGYSINETVFMGYLEKLKGIEKKASGKSFTLDAILSLDGVINKEKSAIKEDARISIQKSCLKAIDLLISMREKEGKSAEKDILNSLNTIGKDSLAIKKLFTGSAKRNFEKMQERIAKFYSGELDSNRLYSELAVMTDKLDINEELVRLADHMKKFKETVKDPMNGKKLDFLAQEMFREINTIGSKSNDSSISHLCVNVKNNIDKIREQCRNIV